MTYDEKSAVQLLALIGEKLVEERKLMLEILGLFRELITRDLVLALGAERIAREVGLTKDQCLKRLQAARVTGQYKEVREHLERGDICLSQVCLIASQVNRDNVAQMLKNIAGKSYRETKAYLSAMAEDGSVNEKDKVYEVRIHLTKDQMQKMERLREVTAARGKILTDRELIELSLDDALEVRDPVIKAKKRAKKPKPHAAPQRKSHTNPSKTIPQKVLNQVWLRDQGRCQYQEKGKICGEKMMLEVDHIIPRCRNGSNNPENLRLLCRHHNQHTIAQTIGFATMKSHRF